jgi:hypothetical protein
MALYQLNIDDLNPLMFFAESDKEAKKKAIAFGKMEGEGFHKLVLRKASKKRTRANKHTETANLRDHARQARLVFRSPVKELASAQATD